MAATRWLPLESNPEVMNKYVHTLGVDEGTRFQDVIGLSADLLSEVPKPVLAVLLLYPRTEKSEKELIGEIVQPSDVYFMKQSIGNACGTVGIVHAILNNTGSIKLDGDKTLSKFLDATKGLSPEERARHLEEDTAFGDAHEESAQEGQTQAPDRDEKVNLHFVAFVHHGGELIELDGRKDGPVKHGPTTPDSLLEDTAGVVKKFMARDPNELNFNLIALVKSD